MDKKKVCMSASLIGSLKACPFQCYVNYVLGIVPDIDSDALRQGSNWHRMLEIMKMGPSTVCPECANKGQKNPNCPLCEGTDILPGDLMEAAVRQLNKSYEHCPVAKTREEWQVERTKLLYSLAGYNWRYSGDDYEVIARELRFDLPLRNLTNSRALPGVYIRIVIDKLIRATNGIICVMEHKSTSSSLDSDSSYWNHLSLDTQTNLYPWALSRLQLEGKLEYLGIMPDDRLIQEVKYDVWRKPTIAPKMLSQANSKKFVETGEYMGEKFKVLTDDVYTHTVNGEQADIEPGKKEGTFAIKETPDMYGARLLADITERPDFYFARRDLVRTEKDFQRLDKELLGIYRSFQFMKKNNCWWRNERQCEAKYKCQYMDICYNNIDLSTGVVPAGFKNKYQEKKDGDKTANSDSKKIYTPCPSDT